MKMNPPVPPPILGYKQTRAPLSYSQESLWFLHQLDSNSCAYNLNYHYKFIGGVNHSAIEKAFNVLVRRVEPFRTLYPSQEGIPVQVVQPFVPFSLPYVDLSELEEEDQQHKLKERITALSNSPFDLQQGPLFRVALFHISNNEDHLYFGTHHIGFDGWSRSIMLAELQKLYSAFVLGNKPELPEQPIQNIDYAMWQKEWLSGDALAAYLSHWENLLSGALPVLALPVDFPRPPVQSYAGSRQNIDISPDSYTRIKDFCRKENLTPFRFFMAVYAILLMRHSNQEDLIIGVPFANRSVPALNEIQGYFVNTLPVRLNLAKINTVQELFDHIRTTMRDAKTWQSAPSRHIP